MLKLMLTIASLVIALTGLTRAGLAAGEAERAVLVLDVSGSMWGQVDNTPKIAVARDVIGKLVRNWNPKVRLGLTVYGHREKGNCSDIENLVPVGKVDANAIMAIVNGLNPKGKTPLSNAVRQAARELRYTEERATVILVSDGKETCNANPCAMASELEKNGIDFTVHVVGFDLTNEEKAQLRCIADNTGGKFLSANSASELHKAMATTVQLVAEAKPAKQRVVKLKTGLAGTLRITGVKGRPAFVYAPGKTYKQAIVRFGPRRKPSEQLKPGTYVIGNRNQEITRVEIAAGKSVVVDMADVSGTVALKGLIGGSVYLYEPGKSYKQALTQFVRNRKTPEQLKPGTYIFGKRNQELARVEVAAGNNVVVDMADVTGSVAVKGIAGRLVYVYEPGKTYKQALAQFVRNRKTPEQLKPGSYVIGMRQQELKRIDVAAGERHGRRHGRRDRIGYREGSYKRNCVSL